MKKKFIESNLEELKESEEELEDEIEGLAEIESLMNEDEKKGEFKPSLVGSKENKAISIEEKKIIKDLNMVQQFVESAEIGYTLGFWYDKKHFRIERDT